MRESSADTLPAGARMAMVLIGFSGQLAWSVENQFFNTFLYDKITPTRGPFRGWSPPRRWSRS